MLSYDIEDIATSEVGSVHRDLQLWDLLYSTKTITEPFMSLRRFENLRVFFRACLQFDQQPDLGEDDDEPRKSLVHALYESYKTCWSDEQR